ncbi:serine/threonine protein kinase, partial [Candidatus Sumerlaeota bacterium]|nr:serine/threonine protein kinase [Candidatus Sumerlaeota bacterium]
MPGIEYSAGDRIGGYVVLSLIGRGGMSVVYKGYDELLNRDVAIKVLHSNLLNDVDALRRFEREAEAISKIKHRNVAQIYSFGQTEDNVPFLILEYIDGPTFAQIIEKKVDFSVRELTEFMIQAVEGFRAAYQNDIIHRDIKPQNLMLDYENVVKVLDFGLAKILWDETSKTVEGTIVGTPYYMSPEMASGRPIDHRGDIYSLGATFYHILARRPVFEADTPLGIMLKHTTAQPVPLYLVNPKVSIGLWEIIQRMLEKDPNDRYQTYDELLSDLKMELLAIQNRERESADFSDYKEIIPLQEEVSSLQSGTSEETPAYTDTIPASEAVPDIESERRKRALAIDIDARKKSSWGIVVFFIAFLLVISGVVGLMFSL